MSFLDDSMYPRNELASPPLAQPLRKPSLVPSVEDREEDFEPFARSTSGLSGHSSGLSAHSSTATIRRKHESYNLSGSIFLVTASGKTLNLPVPSDSPNDPLNWSRWKTAGAIAAIAWYSIVSLTVVQAASMVYHGILVEFENQNLYPWTMETLSTAPTLFMGFGALLWVPLSLGMGRRPVFLIASLMMSLATIGAGHSANFSQLLTCLCFLGLGEGFSLTCALLLMIEMTFIHQRPRAIALLWSLAGFAGTAGLALVPYISSHGEDWRQFYHYWSIPMLISFILIFFLFPETYFKRPTVAFDGLILLQTATEKLTVYKDEDADSNIYRDLPDLPCGPRTGFNGIRDRLGLCRSPFASWTAVWHCYYQMAFCAVNPLIAWVFIASSFNFAGMLFIGATYAQILRAPPYSLSSSLIVNVNICSGIGALFAFPLGGMLISKILSRLARRNKGVREAEHFLIAYILPVLTGALSTFIYGFAVQRKLHFAFFYLAYGLNGFSWTTLSISNTMWVTEAFPRWAAPAISVLGGGCYILSFAMSFALVPWISAHGYKLVGIELAALQILGGLVAVPIAFWGKNARQAIHGKWADERAGALRPL
ncbi:major facilitator superfamily domain-containing protein [Boeremia exigua]|uniref:major facilitator superfamily domain-containing protein n=1 Tax=Boeremia exigua TaxID=749465 RepID=UPI001E8D9E16|nr:major facilitator superfamily domain-containing protein [Boeremia exigua]KAH6644801.1 major facilitator superfamily domain-containing protein [Boeremia exigua]